MSDRVYKCGACGGEVKLRYFYDCNNPKNFFKIWFAQCQDCGKMTDNYRSKADALKEFESTFKSKEVEDIDSEKGDSK